MVELDFSAYSVLVAGGTSGINRAIARAFAEQGAAVAVFSRDSHKVDDTLAELARLTRTVAGFSADVRDYDALERGLASLPAGFESLDAVISGAAGNFPALANDMSPKGFKAVIDIDLLGGYNVLRAVYPRLKKPGASVINISAPQAQAPTAGQAHVGAAKAGLDMLTRTLCLEWGPDGIRVNAVVPGPIDDTEGMRRLAPTEGAREHCRVSVPLQRLGRAQDIAHACLYLASPLAEFISGAIIPVDGGWLQNGYATLSQHLSRKLQSE